MRFAMLLLAFLTAACLAGSLIPQGNLPAWYQGAYPRAAGVILFLRLDDVFHSVWFLALTLFLCLNLISCSLVRFPALVRKTRSGFSVDNSAAGPAVLTGDREQARALFSKMGFRTVRETARCGSPALYAVKNRAGLWGAWLCHLGILIVIIGFGFGQRCQFEASVYGIPGRTLPVEGTNYDVTIDSFSVLLRPDETVDQYVAGLTITDRATGRAESGTASVNHPLSVFGLKFYQNSTGWGAWVRVEKDGRTLQDDFLCAGEYTHIADRPQLHVMLRAFYPDCVMDAAGMPMTASSALNNPAYLYMLYNGETLLGMNVLPDGQVIRVDDYTIVFHDPQTYTLIQIKKDPFEKLALVGGGVILAALLLAFYLQPAELWAVEDGGVWRVGGRRRRDGGDFREELLEKGRALGLNETGRKENDVPAD